MRFAGRVLIAVLTVALASYALDGVGMTTPEQAMQCCNSMRCPSHGHHGQDCCKSMPSVHAALGQPSSMPSVSFSLIALGMHVSKAFPQFIAGNSSAPSVTGRLFKACGSTWSDARSEEHTSELQSRLHLVCRLLLEKRSTQYIPSRSSLRFFFFNDTATTEIYTLSLHDALPISMPSVSFSLIALGMHVSKAFPQFIAGNSSAPSVTGRLFKACGSTWSDANSVAHFDAASRCFSRAVLSPPRCETSGNDV